MVNFNYVSSPKLVLSRKVLLSSLVTNPPESLSHLVDLYDSTLSNLLDKHAPIVTKQSARVTPSKPWFTDSLRTAT